jgi:hypothetical protein
MPTSLRKKLMDACSAYPDKPVACIKVPDPIPARAEGTVVPHLSYSGYSTKNILSIKSSYI